jgi:hypothetical protein
MLKRIWNGWRRFGQWLGDQVARVFLVLFYFTLALPVGLIVRVAQDPLDVKNKKGTDWVSRRTRDRTLDDARRNF